MTDLERLKKYKKLVSQMKNTQESYREEWREIADWLNPKLGKYLKSETETPTSRNKDKSHKKRIITGIARRCLDVFSRGIKAGISSKTKKWVRFKYKPKGIGEEEKFVLKAYLNESRDSTLSIIDETNFYSAIEAFYKQLGAFGTAAMIMLPCYVERKGHAPQLIEFIPLQAGEYYLSKGEGNIVDTIARRFTKTAYQLELEFGRENLPKKVIEALNKDQTETVFTVVHLILPNNERRIGSELPEDMAYASYYYLEDIEETEPNLFLRGGKDNPEGHRSKPFDVCMWDIDDDSPYGSGVGESVLSDVKQLQKMSVRKLETLDKHLSPPLSMPASMKNNGDYEGTHPGAKNYVPDMSGGEMAVRPTVQVNGDITGVSAEIKEKSQEIREWFMVDIFFATLNVEKQMTAFEVSQRTSERLQMLGPAIERIQEFLDQVIRYVFDVGLEYEVIPELKIHNGSDYQKIPYKIDYQGVLAQAQKMKEVEILEQSMSVVGSLAASFPDAADNVDTDAYIESYFDVIGTPSKIQRSREEREEIRQGRAKKEEEAAALQRMTQIADGAKTVSEVNMTENNGLTNLLGAI